MAELDKEVSIVLLHTICQKIRSATVRVLSGRYLLPRDETVSRSVLPSCGFFVKLVIIRSGLLSDAAASGSPLPQTSAGKFRIVWFTLTESRSPKSYTLVFR